MKPGDKVGEWTLLAIAIHSPSGLFRQWQMQCSCGYKTRRIEKSIKAKTHSATCGACASARTAAKAREPK